MKEEVFSREIIEKALSSPKEIEKAKKYGAFFQYIDRTDETLIAGYKWNGVIYITDISHNHKRRRKKK